MKQQLKNTERWKTNKGGSAVKNKIGNTKTEAKSYECKYVNVNMEDRKANRTWNENQCTESAKDK